MPAHTADSRVTERRNPRTQEIDLADSLGIVDLMSAEDREVPLAVAGQREPIAAAITAAEETFRQLHGVLELISYMSKNTNGFARYFGPDSVTG